MHNLLELTLFDSPKVPDVEMLIDLLSCVWKSPYW